MKIVAIDDEKLALKVLTNAISEAMPEADITTFLDVEDALSYISENDVAYQYYRLDIKEIVGDNFEFQISEFELLHSVLATSIAFLPLSLPP